MIKSMKELETVPKNDYKVISTFSGCGGGCLGFKAAGYSILSAVEFIPEAAKTYRANFPGTFVYETDIRDIRGSDILNRFGLERGEVDVLEGSPPCSDFSQQRNMGNTTKGTFKVYSETRQRVDDLFLEYARILGEVSPKVFVAENVANLKNNPDYYHYFRERLSNAGEGYIVQDKVIDFSSLGVPQSRKRIIFMGVRKDIGLSPVFPTTSYEVPLTTKDAIGDLIDSAPDMQMTDLEQFYSKLIPVGAGTKYLMELRKKYKLKIMVFNHRRDVWDRPHPTLVHNTRHIHQLKNRWLTVLEGKRIQTFPDDFVLTGNTNQQWERVGRAVPPQAYYALFQLSGFDIF